MKDFKKDLNDVVKTVKTLAVKVEKLQKQYAEMVRSHPKMPTKKAPTKKAAAKKTVTKKPAPKRAQTTATDAVLGIVNRSKKGVDTANVMKKTGFDRKKVANIFARMKKQGKIRSAGKGIYVKAYGRVNNPRKL